MKLAIITLYGFFNYGNRLQNYALQEALTGLGCDVSSIAVESRKEVLKGFLKRYLEKKDGKLAAVLPIERRREKNFKEFTKRYITTKRLIKENGEFDAQLENQFDCFVVGSDQVWNPLFWEKEGFQKSANNYLLKFVKHKKKISYAASFGIGELSEEHQKCFKEELPKFDKITVREEAGVLIAKDAANVTADVVLDPTMLLSREKWRTIEKGYYDKKHKYVVIYFLGEQPKSVYNYINEFAQSIGADVIDMMDTGNADIYQRGPESFVELIDKAEAVFTDSFHATVFSVLFHTPFITYGRHHTNKSDMNSRIETLLCTLAMQDRFCVGDKKIPVLPCDFSKADILLCQEKERSINILKETIFS